MRNAELTGENGSKSIEITKGVHWVGVRDPNRRLFQDLVPLPDGTTYNAYLVRGEKQAALVDTVNPGFELQMEASIRELVDPSEVGYVIMNHAEPDHAGGVVHALSLNGDAKLVATRAGARMAQVYFRVPEDRIQTVVDGEVIDLGGKTLRFMAAPMLHWPETMFTYLQEDGILFTCDFFGSQVAKGFYEDEVDNWIARAQTHFGEAMLPFRTVALKALERMNSLDLRLIAPGHGPIIRDTSRIMEAYGSWASGKTKRKVTIIYVSLGTSTEKLVLPLERRLVSEGVEVVKYHLTSANIGDLAKNLVDSRAIVFGSPTVLGGAHPLAAYAAYLVSALRPPAKFCAILSSYGWGSGALRSLRDMLATSGMQLVGSVDVNGPPTPQDEIAVEALGQALAGKIMRAE